MLSTLMNYRLYSADMAKSLARIASQATVERDADYYKANIGKVKTPEDLLKDQRLYAYAMKAYGLEDQIQSKGLMRKVLESDLSKTDSFANKLVDKRYREFAAAFQFGSASKAAIQTASQTEALTEAYSSHRVTLATRASADVNAFKARLGELVQGTTNPDVAGAIVNDPALLSFLEKATDLEPLPSNKDAIRQALTGGTLSSHPGLVALRDMFNFNADGSIKANMPLQTAAQIADLSSTYFDSRGAGATSQAAAVKTTYFQQAIAGVDTAGKLASDPQLLNYTLSAFGIDPSLTSAGFVENILRSQRGDANSALAQMPETTAEEIASKQRFTALNAAFAFKADGTRANGGTVFATGFDAQGIEDRFYQNYQTFALQDDKRKTSVFQARLSNMKTINDLLGRDAAFGKSAFDYILTAFDIDPSTESSSKIRRVLLSDPSDPTSYVSRLKDERYERLAAAFNFGPDGKATTQRLAQSVSAQTATGSLYTASFGTDVNAAKKELIRKDTETYLGAIGKVRSLDDLLDDKKTVAYALKAYGLSDENLSDRDLKRLFTSDLGDPKSFANAKGDKRYVDLVSAFNFTPSGTIQRDGEGVQSGAKLLSTQNRFLLQTMESQVGEQSEGARLALYFLRKAPDVTSAYGILADKALFEVARTALGLPAGISGMAIESQAKLLESKIDFKDFQDAKKLDKFIVRFSSIYDSQNSAASSPILALFGNSAGSNGIISLL
ncbi:DUF1217 domain-containing protein [Aureimonas phyllosphaerae]|uniref:DUF1217 domain-containing protein n=1 Tax=Aureimonas phyllosphaerae TaxID=1166078 RepID=A0A7W6BZA9_9HYPH|nr:DUF1217 domain-containing protein [Aureimonas phyllosphaerae]MBB3935547.1 hypothetical protein [Aureimonas phyllosphaerae]MBB3959555.1 hypothetical protein [Aureimonas phyllosphaerae]